MKVGPEFAKKDFTTAKRELIAGDFFRASPVCKRDAFAGHVLKADIRCIFWNLSGINPGEVPKDTPYVGLEHMPRKSIALANWARSEEVASNKFAFRRGEILFGKLRPYFHKVGVAAKDGVCSTDILVVSAKSEEW